MLQQVREGHFSINRETAKDPAFMANVIDRQALFNFYDQKPYQDVTQYLRRKTVMDTGGREGMYETPFSDFLTNNGRRITTTENEIRYRKVGKGKLTFRVLRTTGLTYPGLRNETFPIVLNTNVFKPGDKIGPEQDWAFILVVQSLPRPTGDGFEYTVQSIDPDPHSYYPVGLLRENTTYVKRGSSNYSEGSLDWGSTLWDKGASVLTWRVGLFKTGKELKITDEALNHVFTLDPKCMEGGKEVDLDDPRVPKSMVSEAEINFVAESAHEKEDDLLWSTYTTRIADTSTRLYREIGAGLFDFVKDGHIFDYSPTNSNVARELSDFTESVWYNTTGQIHYGTGRPGMELADYWIKREFGEISVIRDYQHYIERSGNIIPGGAEAWKLKRPMFNAYDLPIGGTIQFDLWPWLDDRSRKSKKHPTTNKPLLGYHYFGMRYQGEGVGSNIVMVDKANSTIFGYEAGAVGPYAPIDDRRGGKYVMTHSGRYATLRYGESYGMFLEDISDLLWYRPNIS